VLIFGQHGKGEGTGEQFICGRFLGSGIWHGEEGRLVL